MTFDDLNIDLSLANAANASIIRTLTLRSVDIFKIINLKSISQKIIDRNKNLNIYYYKISFALSEYNFTFNLYRVVFKKLISNLIRARYGDKFGETDVCDTLLSKKYQILSMLFE